MDGLIPIINKLQEVFDAFESDDDHGYTIDGAISGRGISSLDLPRIVVVGSQSSGKSSVLESLVQRDFLPRGKDIVTRRPLVLQLVHTPCPPRRSISNALGPSGESISYEEWGEFGHWPGKKYRDFLAIRREIEMETERVAGPNKAISRQPINLRIYSPRVVNLTLVDLPGITKIPIGDQPPDIEQQLRSLIMEYASRPNSVILAITPANTDLVNSDALKLAQEVDPTGSRTIGVLTKLDLMDAGTHAADILLNRAAFRLRLGFVGVVNRSQHDININKPISDALKQEVEFFRNHSQYRPISHRCGSQFLAKELNKILLQHIREQLPELRSHINALILATQNELTSLGDLGLPGAIGSTDKGYRGSLLLKLVTLYVSDFQDAINGLSKITTFTTLNSIVPVTGAQSISNESECELRGGARINQIFSGEYTDALTQIEERTTSTLSVEEVRTAIRHSSGPRPALFVPEASFDLLARKLISSLAIPAQRCADAVFEELIRLAHRSERRELKRFPKLLAKLVSSTTTLLRERLAPTLTMIEGLVNIEMAYINTNHPDFGRHSPLSMGTLSKLILPRLGGTSTTMNLAISSPPTSPILPTGGPTIYEGKEEGGLFSFLFKAEPKRSAMPTMADEQSFNAAAAATTTASPTTTYQPYYNTNIASPTVEREEAETHLIIGLLQSYFAIVRKNLQDTVPKAIMHFLVNYMMENLGTRLVSDLYREEMLSELLEEDEGVIRQRARCKTALEAYRQAAEILTDLRDTADPTVLTASDSNNSSGNQTFMPASTTLSQMMNSNTNTSAASIGKSSR